jgi:hypothetical protein
MVLDGLGVDIERGVISLLDNPLAASSMTCRCRADNAAPKR